MSTSISTSAAKANIAIIYYSMYGHIKSIAQSIVKGVESSGAEAKLFQIPETLSTEILAKMHAPPKDSTIPIVTINDLVSADGILFGIPTRYGSMPAQVKSFIDSTGSIWQSGALIGKPYGIFFSTGTQGGGQETTALTSLTNFTHHGMIYVPIGYSTPLVADMSEMHGGSPYGAGTFAGATGNRQPSKIELGIAEHQGKLFGTTATALKLGRAALANQTKSQTTVTVENNNREPISP